MAKMIKDTQIQVHPVTGEEGSWSRAYKTWINPKKPGDRIYKGMIWYVKGTSIIRDKTGKDITEVFKY